MKLDEETQDKLQELRIGEQNLQNILLQKQAFQIELHETEAAIEEAENSSGDIYKIVGQIMINSKKEEILKQLQEKKETLILRVKAIENQEKFLNSRLEKLKKEIEEKLKTNKK